jgi:3'-5' exoribonuclease
MARRFINQLADREDVHEVFLASEKQLRPNRNGHLYLQVRLSDRTGSINAMMWNASDRIYQAFENGDYVQVQGTAQVYNGNLQVIVNQIDAAEQRDVHEDDFVHLGERERARLLERLQQLLAGMRHASLRNLAETFFADSTFVARFIAAPAGIKQHHAYAGGLLEHVVSLAELSLAVAPRYPNLDPDLLLMGAFLHDIGKIEELVYDRALS